MSRTDKDRPGEVQCRDPLNRRFFKIGKAWWGTEDSPEWPWKKLWPATQCWCCSQKRAWRSWHRRQRHQAQRVCREMAKGGEGDG